MIPDNFKEVFYQILVKYILPAIIIVNAGIIIRLNKIKLSLFNVFSSNIVGIAFAVVFGPAIYEALPNREKLAMAFVGLLVILGDRLGNWLIFEFDLDRVANTIIDKLMRVFKRK